jgi:hypothetical protein
MAGLIADQAAQGMAQEAPVPASPQEGPPQAAQDGDIDELPEPGSIKEEEPTPDEQEAFTRVEIAAKKTIHDSPPVFQKFVEILENGKDAPAKTLARAALLVFQSVDDAAGGDIPEEVIIRGMEVCLDLIIKLAEDTGTMQVDETTANRAMQELVLQGGELYEYDTENLREAMAAEEGGGQPAQEQAQAQQPAQAQPAAQPVAQPAQAPAPQPGVM